jgi:hypothetical protein
MIDKTLACMIDESLRRIGKLSGADYGKMLEVRVNRAHLSCQPIWIATLGALVQSPGICS